MDPFLGQITMFGGSFAPRGWAFCEGQLLPISQYTALFSILGTTYGGDGRTTFGLPDLRGRAPIHAGHGPGLSDVRLGQKGGNEMTTLNVTNLPSHNHTGTISVGPDTNLTDAAVNNRLATEARGGGDALPIYTSDAGNGNMAGDSVTIGNAGGNQAFSNRSPYLVISHIIALQGIFPSRS
jgi:microcystin-dependent protein